MAFKVKEMFLTLQGEGFNCGKRAVFVRFSGCNLWSGLEKDRVKAKCDFCDTDFVGTNGLNGGVYKQEQLINQIEKLWGANEVDKFVVFTGGEPTLQITVDLIEELKNRNWFTAVETNGTIPIVADIDWITVSPKTPHLAVKYASELKLVYPQKKVSPELFINGFFRHFYLQPKDDKNYKANAQAVVQYCLLNPQWRLSVQAHKVVGIM